VREKRRLMRRKVMQWGRLPSLDGKKTDGPPGKLVKGRADVKGMRATAMSIPNRESKGWEGTTARGDEKKKNRINMKKIRGRKTDLPPRTTSRGPKIKSPSKGLKF